MTTRNKKALALVLSGGLLAIAAVGCGSDSGSGNTTASPTGGTTQATEAAGPVGTTCPSFLGQTPDQQKSDSAALAKNNGSADPSDNEVTLTRLALTVFCNNTKNDEAVIDDVYAWALEALGDKEAEPLPQPDADVTNDPFKGATADGGILVGQNLVAGGPVPADVVRVDLVSDYSCPYCKMLEDELGEQLRELTEAGQIMFVFHPLAFLDNHSTNKYSTRAANAVVTVAAKAPEQFVAFDQLLWENQPSGGADGLTDEDIAALAKQAGVSDAVIAELPGMPFADFVKNSTKTNTSRDGFKGTPWVLLSYGDNSYSFSWSKGDLEQAIVKVKAGQAP